MSEPTPTSLRPAFFRPLSLLIGFVGGLIFFAWLGRHVTTHDWHKDFVRFHPMIAPESYYQPTVGEMCAIVRSHCRPDQVLVIVGGNSILLGVGQAATDVWSQHLQERLGDKFAVVNLAFRGAGATDGGAVVAEVLRNEFPRQILIGDVTPMEVADPVGTASYRFMFFDAYYKGLLIPWQSRDEGVMAYFNAPKDLIAKRETRWGAKLDAYFHYEDFWNWWNYTQCFTFPTTYQPKWPEAFWARGKFPDAESVYDNTPFNVKFPPAVLARELEIAHNYSGLFYDKDASGKWTLKSAYRTGVETGMEKMFPEPLRKRTLMIICRNSPYYTSQLAADLRDRDDLAIRDTIELWHQIGITAIDPCRGFVIDDYGDRSHMTAQGGAKMASNVAPAVRTLATHLGYLKP